MKEISSYRKVKAEYFFLNVRCETRGQESHTRTRISERLHRMR